MHNTRITLFMIKWFTVREIHHVHLVLLITSLPSAFCSFELHITLAARTTGSDVWRRRKRSNHSIGKTTQRRSNHWSLKTSSPHIISKTLCRSNYKQGICIVAILGPEHLFGEKHKSRGGRRTSQGTRDLIWVTWLARSELIAFSLAR